MNKAHLEQVAPALSAFQALLDCSISDRYAEAFVLGAFAKAVATVVTYPLVRLKTNL